MADKHHNEQGAVALEAALVMPVAMLVVLGGLTLAHAMFTQTALSSAVHDAARTCTLSGAANPAACARSETTQHIGNAARWCNGGPTVTARVTRPGGPNAAAVSQLRVDVVCSYAGLLARGGGSLADMTSFDIRARTVMAF